ncbi:MAG TPA: hypothetical protein VI643_07270 [Planctomycetota bacterium]|nr:hypothetical protein [Planctomycetota bacterium]
MFGYLLGRFLQVVGLLAVPIGVLLSIEQDTLRPEFIYLLTGGIAFALGWVLVHRFGRQS